MFGAFYDRRVKMQDNTTAFDTALFPEFKRTYTPITEPLFVKDLFKVPAHSRYLNPYPGISAQML